MSEPYVLQLLSRPFNPFSFTKSQSRSSFETKTAAINVTPTNSNYSINEIKEDALWLSKQAEIDEVSALRIVVLEYQSRSSAQLRGEFSDEEAASLHEAGGNINTETSNLLSRALRSKALSSDKQTASFNSQDGRRVRALEIYLSERRYLLKCTDWILHSGLRADSITAPPMSGGAEAQSSWLERLGEQLIATFHQDSDANEFLLYCIKALKANIERLGKGSGWYKSEGGREDIELEWLSSQIAEAIHTMEIIFLLLDYQKDSRTSTSVLEWFRFAASYGFFDQFTPVSRC